MATPKMIFRKPMYPEFPFITERMRANLITHHRGYKIKPLPSPVVSIANYPKQIFHWRLYEPLINLVADYCQVFVSWYQNSTGHPSLKFIGFEYNVELFKILWPYLYESLGQALEAAKKEKSKENFKRRARNRDDKGLDARTYASGLLEIAVNLLCITVEELLEDYQNDRAEDSLRWFETIENWILVNDKPQYDYKHIRGERQLSWARAGKSKMTYNRIINI